MTDDAADTQAADTTAADPETVVVPDMAPTGRHAAELAWSTEDDTDDYAAATERYRWENVAARAFLIVACAGALAYGAVQFWPHHQAPPASPPASASPSPTSASAATAQLDGLWRVVSDNQHSTLNGQPWAVADDETFYLAFRSSCASGQCVATSTRVDENRQPIPHSAIAWRWTPSQWNEDPIHLTRPCSVGGPAQIATELRTLVPQPDNSLKGTETDTLDAGCGEPAKVVTSPLAGVRIGDTPPGIVADPASAPPPGGDTATIGTPAPPSSAVADKTFLNLASQVPGISIKDGLGLIASARGVCTELTNGTETRAEAVTRTEQDTGASPEQAEGLVRAAIAAYCPQQG
jgi:hypothetical protein